MNKKQLLYIVLGIGIMGIVAWKSGLFETAQEPKVTEVQKNGEEKTIEKPSAPEESSEISKEQKVEEKAVEAPLEAEKATQSEEKVKVAETAKGLADKLNTKASKAVVLFKDGSSVDESDINDEMDKLPEQISEKMSLKEVKTFLAIKGAFDHVITVEAKKEGIEKDPKVVSEIKKKIDTVAGMILLNDKAEALMTDAALKAHYDKIWNENFKGTKEFSLKVISTSNKILADDIVKNATDENKLNTILESNKGQLKAMDLENKPESSLPPEVIAPIKEKGVNGVVGPFPIRDVFMVFFVKNVRDAQKREFSSKFKEDYKKIALKDFVKQVNDQKYKDNQVVFYDINGKKIDLDKQVEEIRSKSRKKGAPDDQFDIGKLTDDTVLATIGETPVKALEVRQFFKLKTLQDDSLLMMAQQFNMKLSEVLVYATKLTIEDRLLAKEAEDSGYFSKPEVLEKIKEVEKAEIARVYLKKHITVPNEEIRKMHAEFIKSIPEEDKNDHEVSVKIAFFSDKVEANKALESINSGQVKFSAIFKEKEASKTAIDFKYVGRSAVDPELWTILKRSPAGACYKDIVEVDGSKYGVAGMNYIVIFVGDRREISLPSLANPADKKYFEAMAYQKVAKDFVTALMQKTVSTIAGVSMTDMAKDAIYGKMIEAIVAGTR